LSQLDPDYSSSPVATCADTRGTLLTKSAADDSSYHNTLCFTLLHSPSLINPHTTYESPQATIMIAPSCAWVRVSLRRIPNAPSPRNSNAGTPSHFEHTRFRFNPHTSRRYNAPRPNAGQINESAQTIPGPSWLWLEPIVEPFRAYGRVQQRKPYMTQLVSSLVIYFVGDLVAQSISPTASTAESLALVEDAEEKGWVQEWSNNRDWSRTGRALVIGGLSSIPSYKWFLWLSNNFNYSSKLLSITTKVCIFSPTVCLSMLTISRSQSTKPSLPLCSTPTSSACNRFCLGRPAPRLSNESRIRSQQAGPTAAKSGPPSRRLASRTYLYSTGAYLAALSQSDGKPTSVCLTRGLLPRKRMEPKQNTCQP